MGSKRDRSESRERRSPNQTVSNYTDDFMEDLDLPTLPGNIPQRLADALHVRIKALLYQLREARTERYVQTIEIRLVRETLQAVLTAMRNFVTWYRTWAMSPPRWASPRSASRAGTSG